MADIINTAKEYVKSKLHERTILVGSKEQMYEYFEMHANSDLLEVLVGDYKMFEKFNFRTQIDTIADTSPNGYGKVMYINKEKSTPEDIVTDSKYILIKKY